MLGCAHVLVGFHSEPFGLTLRPTTRYYARLTIASRYEKHGFLDIGHDDGSRTDAIFWK